MLSAEPKISPINVVFVVFVMGAILFAGLSGRMQEAADASIDAAKGAVTLALGLIGIMALWLGFVRILEAGGMMRQLARLMRPVMVRLFPDVPAEHPAMSAMLLNISANMLGLGNAATPFGIKAMVDLNRLNPFPGIATNAMCLFLAINTSSVALLPLGVMGVRAAAGSTRPFEMFVPTLVATLASTFVGVLVATWWGRRDAQYREEVAQAQPVDTNPEGEGGQNTNRVPPRRVENEASEPDYSHLVGQAGATGKRLAVAGLILLTAAAVYQAVSADSLPDFLKNRFVGSWLMPVLIFLIFSYGLARGVRIYEAVTEGARQGFDIAVRIIPFLVAILVAIRMFRASGAMELLASVLNPVTRLIGMPGEVLPMALVRPLSGSGAFGIMAELVEAAPDSYSAYVASTLMGSTETTFYVLAVYFGAVGVSRIRHALVAGLSADVTGLVVASLTCRTLWTGD
jgi:spore maturation protein SpmA